MERFWSKVDKRGPDECWEWQGRLRKDGYANFFFSKRSVLAHRQAFELHNGRPANGVVMHSCNNKRCCNPAHLVEGTQQQNCIDAYRDGLKPKTLKLSGEEVAEIRWLRAIGARNGDVAASYGISKQHVSSITSGHRRAA